MAAGQMVATVGPAGSGKTLLRGAYFLADQFLPFETGIHYSNFPIYADRVGEFVAKRHKLDAKEIAARVVRIPPEILEDWEQEISGPWEFFKGKNLDGAHIAIDECHNYLGKKHSASHRRNWAKWCGEIRHRGASIEFLTQDKDKLAEEVLQEIQTLNKITASEYRADPIFGILQGDWYELIASFTGKFSNKVILREHRKTAKDVFTFERAHVYLHRPEYYALYDTQNLPEGEKDHSIKADGPKRMYQKLDRGRLIRWFLVRNWWQLSTRFGGLFLILWFFIGGGINLAISQGLKTFAPSFTESGLSKKTAPVPVPKKSVARPAPKPIHSPAPSPEFPPAEIVRSSTGLYVVAILENSALLSDGVEYFVQDEVISDGARERIKSIEYHRSRVVCESGRVFGFRPIAVTRTVTSDLPGFLPGTSPGGFRTGQEFGGNGTRDDSGGGNVSRGVRENTQPQNRPTDRTGGSFGLKGRNVVSQGEAARRSSASGGTTGGR